ncbi:MAG TPA: hypothetical protein PLR91_10200 [Kiritimatiellia bacterium]|mgnify:FL=1|nr:hypothetical protein [Kiritimatiellia bacterium]
MNFAHLKAWACAGWMTATLWSAYGADRTWTGQGGDTLWSNPLNWQDSTAPAGNADVAIFPAGTPAAVLINQN